MFRGPGVSIGRPVFYSDHFEFHWPFLRGSLYFLRTEYICYSKQGNAKCVHVAG
jgi:hypothetical protein